MNRVFSFLFLFCCLGGLTDSAFSQAKSLQRGAYKMPYVRYEARINNVLNGAIYKGPDFDVETTEAYASERSYVELPQQEDGVSWLLHSSGRGLVLRFTMPDTPSGLGVNSALDIFVNGGYVMTWKLSSFHNWLYMSSEGGFHPVNDPSAGRAILKFDEERILLPITLKKGDRLSLKKHANDGHSIGIDFVELEDVPAALPRPNNAIAVTDAPYNAIPNDGIDDHAAFKAAVKAAKVKGKLLYIPEGKYDLSDALWLNDDGVRMMGAGIWYTDLHWTNKSGSGKNGGIYGNANRLHLSDFYMSSELNERANGYRAMSQHWGKGSTIENLWMTHFSVGFWIRDFFDPIETTSGLHIRNLRIRNMYADGCNFANGTTNSLIEHTNIRNCGDDGMANLAHAESINNTFRYVTGEFMWIAAGVGLFAGERINIHHCLFVDNPNGPGIRTSSVFTSKPSPTNSYNRIFENTIIRCGSPNNGAIDIKSVKTDVNNIRFFNIDVLDSPCDGVFVMSYGQAQHRKLNNVYMYNMNFDGVGLKETGDWACFKSNWDSKGKLVLNNIDCNNVNGQRMKNPSSNFQFQEFNAYDNQLPIAKADVLIDMVQGEAVYTLDASASSDPENQNMSYKWIQIHGPEVDMLDANAQQCRIEGVDKDSTYSFILTLRDQNQLSSDVITLRANSPVSRRNMDPESNVRLFPNPASKTLFLENLPNDCEQVDILDANGRFIKRLSLNNFHEIDVSEIKPGAYFLKIFSKRKLEVLKWIRG